MKLVYALVGGLVIATGIGGFIEAAPPSVIERQLDLQTTGSITYKLVAKGGDISCLIRRGIDVSAGQSTLSVADGCEAAVPGIEKANVWREMGDGSIAFVANNGNAIIAFAVADGADYESFGSGAPLVSLVASD